MIYDFFSTPKEIFYLYFSKVVFYSIQFTHVYAHVDNYCYFGDRAESEGGLIQTKAIFINVQLFYTTRKFLSMYLLCASLWTTITLYGSLFVFLPKSLMYYEYYILSRVWRCV